MVFGIHNKWEMGNGKWKLWMGWGTKKEDIFHLSFESNFKYVSWQIHFQYYRIRRTFFGRTLNEEKKLRNKNSKRRMIEFILSDFQIIFDFIRSVSFHWISVYLRLDIESNSSIKCIKKCALQWAKYKKI